jgi:hypothetical protein
VAGDADLRREQGRGEQPRHVGADGNVRVGDRGGFQCRLGDAGRGGGLAPEAGVGQEAGPALRVMHDRDLEEPVGRHLVAEQLPGEEREVGDVLDDGWGDTAARVADDGGFAELEPEDDRGVDAVVEAGDDDHLRGGRAERHGSVVASEPLVALEQRVHPGHWGILLLAR